MLGRFLSGAGAVLMFFHAGMALAQLNGLQPAEPPPEGFQGNRYVDSAGCVFLRSTLNGDIWVPVFGEDSRPLCNGDSKEAPEAVRALADAASNDGDAASNDGEAPSGAEAPSGTEGPAGLEPALPAPADVAGTGAERSDTTRDATLQDAPVETEAPVAPQVAEVPRPQVVPRSAVQDHKEPRNTALSSKERPAARAQSRSARSRPASPAVADASGRHPACPAHAPYGEPVRIWDGRAMVRCVVAPELMTGVTSYASDAAHAPHVHRAGPRQGAAPAPMPALGSYVQVGAFAVAGNALRAQNALVAQGLPVQIRRARNAGRVLEIVLVGPVEPGDGLRATVEIIRSMGYGDAFVRR